MANGNNMLLRLATVGCDPASPVPVNRSIRMSNISALIGAATHLGYGIFYSIHDLVHFLPALAVIITAIPFTLGTLVLNRLRRHAAAAILLNLATPGFVFLNIHLYLGAAVGNHYFFILFSLLPLITLPASLRKWQYAFSSLSVLCFLLIFRHVPTHDLTVVLADGYLTSFLYSSALLSLGAVALVTGIYLGLLHRHEDALILKNETLGETIHSVNRLASTDSLTGLCNRRYLDDCLQTELKRANQTGAPLSVLLFDLDQFKHVNDSFGHDAGDRVLKNMAGFLRENVRHTDAYGRWGGEEFLVILPGTTRDDAWKIAEKLRATLHTLPHPCVGVVTASFGVSQAEPGETMETLYRRVDRAMYIAKASGHNQVAIV